MQIHNLATCLPTRRADRLLKRIGVTLLLIVLSSLLLLSCHDGVGTKPRLRQIKIQHNWLKDIALAGIYCATENGYYRDVGLEVEVWPGGASVDPVVPVVSGSAMIGIHTNATSVLLAKSRGIPIKVIATQYKKSPLGFVAKASSGIHDLQSLKGRRIGVIPSSVSAVELVLKINGFRRDYVEQVVVNSAAGMSLLINDKVDAIVGFGTNQPVQLELAGIKSVFLSFDDLGYHQEAYPYFVADKSVEHDIETLRSFITATQRGWEYALANPEAAARISADRYTEGMDLNKETEVARRQAPLMQSEVTLQHGILYMDRTTWTTTNDLLMSSGLLESKVNLDDLLTWQMFSPAP